MRLSGHLLLQLVEDDAPLLVLMDRSTGAEVTRPLDLETVLHLVDAVAMARIEGGPLVIDGISVPPAAFDALLGALGYFTGRVLG